MSIKRWDCDDDSLFEYDTGEFVLFADHDAWVRSLLRACAHDSEMIAEKDAKIVELQAKCDRMEKFFRELISESKRFADIYESSGLLQASVIAKTALTEPTK
jgi:hypothetical protein